MVNVGTAIAYLDLDNSGFLNNLSKSEAAFEGFTDSSLSLTKRLGALGNGFISLGNTMTRSLTTPIALLGAGFISSAISFESAFAGVEKTVDGTEEQLAKIRTGIQDLAEATTSSANEIAAVAEAAGQLGVATDDILSFTKVMVELGDTTNLSADEAATALARFMNIMGTSNENVENLGSVIVDLGNNFATTESEITQMGTRLASTGKIVGLTESEVLALSAAMSSVGIQAEAGSTAMAQTLTAIEKAVATGSDKLYELARIAGLSSDEFVKAWEERPIEAIQLFLAGLGNLETQGENATLILSELGMEGIRQSNMLKSLASASELLGNSVNVANKAWRQNTALTNEANKRYETTEAKLKQLLASLKNLAIELGEILLPYLQVFVDLLGGWIKAFRDLDENTKKLLINIAMIVASIGPLISILGKLMLTISSISSFIATHPIGAILVGVATLTSSIAILSTELNANNEELDENAKKIRETTAATEELIEKSNTLNGQINNNIDSNKKDIEQLETKANVCYDLVKELEVLQSKTKLTSEEELRQEMIISQLNSSIGGLNLKIDEQTGKINLSTEAIRDNINAMKQQALYQTTQERLTEIVQEQFDAEMLLYDLREQEKEQKEILTEAQEELNKKQQEYNYHLSDTRGMNAQGVALMNLQDKVGAIEDDYESLTNQITETENTIANSNEEYEHVLEISDQVSNSLGIMSEGYDELGNSASGASDDIVIMSDEARQAMQEMYEELQMTIEEQIKLFEKFDSEMTLSKEELLNNMQSQVDGVTEWSENLKKLAEEGIDQGLLSYLASLGPEGAGYVATFVTMSEEELAKAGDLFKEAMILDETAATEITDSYMNLGKSSVEAIAEGVQDEEALEVVNEATDLAMQSMLENLNNAVGLAAGGIATAVDSPLYALGKGIDETISTGITDNKTLLDTPCQDLVNQTLTHSQSFYDSGVSLMNNWWSGMQSVWSSISSWLSSIAAEAAVRLSAVQQLAAQAVQAAYSIKTNGSHANGLSYVPYNGYIAELHEGERVLTKEENKNYGNNNSGGDTFIFNSPKPIDEYQAAKLLKRTKLDLVSDF